MKAPHICLGLIFLSVAACRKDNEIKVYRVVRENPPSLPTVPSGDPHAGASAASGGDPHAGLTADQLAAVGASAPIKVTDSPPSHWKKQQPTSMRQISYLVEGDGGVVTDISLVVLRGAAGGTLGNVNRWRGQLGQPAIDEAALKQSSQTLDTPLGEGVLVEIEGLAPDGDAKKDGRMLGIIAEKDGDAWFYKMRGNAALTAAEKQAFMDWVKTVKPGAAAAPASGPPAGGDGSVTWQVPDGWTLAPAVGSMRYATFNITSAEGSKGEMSVTHFPGDVGGDLENVNRWRKQVDLAPVDAAGLAGLVTKISAGSKAFSAVDLTGPESRLAAGWTRHGADTWFFKLTGPDKLVGSEKTKFISFLESVRFTKPE
jgi:hypothetical protein